MAWIKTIAYEAAEGKLRKLYDRVKGRDDNVDNIMMAHSLRPHTMEGHMYVYKYVLHHPRNTIPRWFLEAVGVYTSMLNGCDYCVEHHYAGMARLLEDEARAKGLFDALAVHEYRRAFDQKQSAAFRYVRMLTLTPQSSSESDIQALRDAGWNDGEILEINQVTAYFAYANRTVHGLGVDTDGDILGLSPGDCDDLGNWTHH